MNNEVIRFEANKAVELTLTSEPKEVQSQISGRVEYRFFCDMARVMFAPPELYDAMLEALDLGEQEPFAGKKLIIAKATKRDGRKQVINWEVARVTAQQPAKAAATAAAPLASVPATRQPQQQQQFPHSIALSASLMREALRASCICWLDTQEFMSSKGQALMFSAGDVRATAATIMIQATAATTATADERAAA